MDNDVTYLVTRSRKEMRHSPSGGGPDFETLLETSHTILARNVIERPQEMKTLLILNVIGGWTLA